MVCKTYTKIQVNLIVVFCNVAIGHIVPPPGQYVRVCFWNTLCESHVNFHVKPMELHVQHVVICLHVWSHVLHMWFHGFLHVIPGVSQRHLHGIHTSERVFFAHVKDTLYTCDHMWSTCKIHVSSVRERLWEHMKQLVRFI